MLFASQAILDAVQVEPGLGDAVAVTADDGAEIRVRAEIAREAVEAEVDVGQDAVPVRHLQRHQDGAVGHDPGLEPGRVGQSEELDGRAVGEPPEVLSLGFHRRISLFSGIRSRGDRLLLAGRVAASQGEDEGREKRRSRR